MTPLIANSVSPRRCRGRTLGSDDQLALRTANRAAVDQAAFAVRRTRTARGYLGRGGGT